MSPTRDPEQMRLHILSVTAEEMRVNGYKAASLAEILDKANVSKGALYHHFANKQELGYAVFEEVFIREFLDDWTIPMTSEQPLDALFEWFSGFSSQVTEEDLHVGCPVCNIATEMSGVDEGFRIRTTEMFEKLKDTLASTLLEAQKKSQARSDFEAESVASFIVAAIQGAMFQGRYARNLAAFKSTIKCMADYLLSLKSA